MQNIEPQGYLSLTPAVSLQISINDASEEVRWRYKSKDHQSEWMSSLVLYDRWERAYFKTDQATFFLHEFQVD